MPYSNSLNERALLLADRVGTSWSDLNPWKVSLEGVEERWGRRGLFVPHAHVAEWRKPLAGNCCSPGQSFGAELADVGRWPCGEKAMWGWWWLCLTLMVLPPLLQKFNSLMLHRMLSQLLWLWKILWLSGPSWKACLKILSVVYWAPVC